MITYVAKEDKIRQVVVRNMLGDLNCCRILNIYCHREETKPIIKHFLLFFFSFLVLLCTNFVYLLQIIFKILKIKAKFIKLQLKTKFKLIKGKNENY